jgi:hypothetical protein
MKSKKTLVLAASLFTLALASVPPPASALGKIWTSKTDNMNDPQIHKVTIDLGLVLSLLNLL